MEDNNVKYIGANNTVCPYAQKSIQTKEYLTFELVNDLPITDNSLLDLIEKGSDAIINISLSNDLSFDQLKSHLINHKTKIAVELFYTRYPVLKLPITLKQNEVAKAMLQQNTKSIKDLINIGERLYRDKNDREASYQKTYQNNIQGNYIRIGDNMEDGFIITYMGPQYHPKHRRYLPQSGIILVRGDKFNDIPHEVTTKIQAKIEKKHKEAGIIEKYEPLFIAPY